MANFHIERNIIYKPFNITIMQTLKEFNEMFGRTPLAVVKTAYGYFQQGHEPGPAISTAAIIYAAKFEKQRLNYTGYDCIRDVSGVTVYEVRTVTESGLTRMSPYSLKDSRGLTIATMGENCVCDAINFFKNQPDSVLGYYTHRNRYTAVVRLNYGTNADLPINTLKKLQHLADVLAMNVVAWWPEYLKKRESLHKFYMEKYKRPPMEFESNKLEFINKQVLRFMPKINEGCEHDHLLCGNMSISAYLRGEIKNQTGLDVRIENVDIYGMYDD